MPVHDADIRRELREFLVREVIPASMVLSDDVALADIGVDSFALMEVILFIETRWGVVLPVEQLTRENVRSVASLGHVVRCWIGEPPGVAGAGLGA